MEDEEKRKDEISARYALNGTSLSVGVDVVEAPPGLSLDSIGYSIEAQA